MRNTMIIMLTTILALCASCNLELAEAPEMTVEPGIVTMGKEVELTTSVLNSVIRYTLNGSDPTASSAVYSSPIAITKNTTIKAASFKGKNIVSDIAVADYRIKTASPVSDVESGGCFASEKTINLSCSDEGSTIYYTLDGTTPTTSSNVYSKSISISSVVLMTKTLKIIAVQDGCDPSDVVEYKYVLYSFGPAGGIVFYDCDADNDTGNADGLKSSECEWKYLEVSPSNIVVGTTAYFSFDYYRTSMNGTNLFVNGSYYVAGTASATDGKSTGTAIGTGRANTEKLVNMMGSAAYTDKNGGSTTDTYAAKLCYDYSYGGYNDWFLPSKDELNVMYLTFKGTGLGGFGSSIYWCSSECASDVLNAWYQFFTDGGQYNGVRHTNVSVRAIRSYLPTEE